MNKRFLLILLAAFVVLVNSCKKEYSVEGGGGPSEGTLQDGGTGDCLPKTVAGAYVVGTVLDGTANYIEVQVDVTTPGFYTIYTDTINGIFFRGTGTFATTGLNTVRLPGKGTPAAAGIHNFVVSYGTSGCSIAVTTSASLGAFTFNGAPGNCTGATAAGTYIVGTALTSANTVNIAVNVTAVGAYTISTTAANGMTFSSSSTFTTPGPQTIVLTGSGTPSTPGATNIPITSGSSTCSFTVNVIDAPSAASFTVNCATATVNGTYTVGTALVSSTNTITLPVTVTTPGSYTITATVNGMTFTATGIFTAATPQNVTLAGSGTPTTAGANTLPVSGGTGTCDISVNVNPAAGGNAVFTTNCATAVINGTYTVGAALVGATNTITLPVNVTTPGAYSITATLNGMTFSSAGTFATATPQNVTLTGSGTPTTQGANVIPVTGGSAACNITVNVNPAAGGNATFSVNCGGATVVGTYTVNTPLGGTNSIQLPVTVTVAGNYSITATLNGMTFTGSGNFATATPQTVTLFGSGTPTTQGPNVITITGGSNTCTVTVTVNPATTSLGTWSFQEGANAFSGTFSAAVFDLTTAPPINIFSMEGETAAGHAFFIDLADVSGTLNSGETYTCATFNGTANAAGFYFDGPPPTFNVLYEADPSITPNTVLITVTSHNVLTKTITGTFAGNAQDGAGGTKAITNGVFTITYP